MFHMSVPSGEIHTICQWVVANSAARLALAPVASDVGKVCLQLDTATPYMVTSIGPVVWVAMSAAGSMNNPMTALKDIIMGGAVTGGVATAVRLPKGNLRQMLRVNYANDNLEYGDDSTVSVIAAPVSNIITIDLSLGDYFLHTLSANISGITFTNTLGANRGMSKMIRLQQNASTPYTFSWPTSFRWEGAAPVISTALGAIDVLALTSFDNGVKWDATLSKGRA